MEKMAEGNLTVEKRHTPRVIVTLPVRYKVISGAAADKTAQVKEQIKTEGCNISKGGLGLLGTENLNKGDLIKVEIEIPGATKPLKTFAEVKWCRTLEEGGGKGPVYRAGISFMAFRHEDDKVLDEYVSRVMRN
jgi:hypothetical protein